MRREIVKDMLAKRIEKLTSLQVRDAFKIRLHVFHWHCYPLPGSRMNQYPVTSRTRESKEDTRFTESDCTKIVSISEHERISS